MCENKVSFWVERGFGHREVKVKCGNTDPWGNRTVCQKCSDDPAERARIKQHEENMEADNAWLRSAGWGEM